MDAGDLSSNQLGALLGRLRGLREGCLGFERVHGVHTESLRLAGADEASLRSARNLLHYLSLRREDLRDLHTPLAELGVSSLGRSEAQVLANLSAVIRVLESLAGEPHDPAPEPPLDHRTSRELLSRRAELLLGPARHAARRIMVTLPGEAAHDESLVRDLLVAGMTVARINTAHDDAAKWERMCRSVREQAGALGFDCRILMDLAGPKIRTGPIEAGPEVLRIKPVRDSMGRTVRPGTITLRPADVEDAHGAEAPVARDWLVQLSVGDEVRLTDTRGRDRLLRVAQIHSDGRVSCSTDRTVYLASGTTLRLAHAGARVRDAHIGRLPPVSQAITARVGDVLLLSLRAEIGRPGVDGRGGVLTTTLPEAFGLVKVGEPLWIDDGKVGTVVERVGHDALELRVTHAPEGGARIRADKGINLPASAVPVAGLTEADIDVLPLAVEHADMVGLSFVREPAEVMDVRARLAALGGSRLGTVLKIETRRAFENLPALLFAALHSPAAGVMIARGDLAIEMGYDRLAEVQEEILWLCEAAHVPVIWATQVLETMAKTGQPSRAEVTDAAMGERAECVMLNKGPYILAAVRFLDDLLRRMGEHQAKKRSVLRALNVARRFGASAGALTP